jgi:Planctomycete cytochrome C
MPCPTNLAEFAAQVLQPSCIDSGCHASDGRAGGLDLETSSLRGPVVVAGDPERSLIIGKLTGTKVCMGRQMPKGATPLAPELIETIAIWICQGAENN